jgi:hypothetical protein
MMIAASPVAGKYDTAVDRESAYEMLQRKAATAPQDPAPAAPRGRQPAQRESATDRFIKNAAGSIGRSLGSALVRGVLGGLMR